MLFSRKVGNTQVVRRAPILTRPNSQCCMSKKSCPFVNQAHYMKSQQEYLIKQCHRGLDTFLSSLLGIFISTFSQINQTYPLFRSCSSAIKCQKRMKGNEIVLAYYIYCSIYNINTCDQRIQWKHSKFRAHPKLPSKGSFLSFKLFFRSLMIGKHGPDILYLAEYQISDLPDN